MPAIHRTRALDVWRLTAARILRTERPFASRHFDDLYHLAIRYGRRSLAKLASRLGIDRTDDLIHEILMNERKVTAIVSANNPQGFFRMTLWNAARDRLWRDRRHVLGATLSTTLEAGRARRDAELDPAFEAAVGHCHRTEADAVDTLTMQRALARLSPRERALAVAAAEGHDREALARRLNTTRTNVDQIVYRIRVDYREALDTDAATELARPRGAATKRLAATTQRSATARVRLHAT